MGRCLVPAIDQVNRAYEALGPPLELGGYFANFQVVGILPFQVVDYHDRHCYERIIFLPSPYG